MEVKQLLFFKRAAELEHMTKAAQELQVSQPFLSHSISELEAELDVKLFDHVGRGIALNSCGRAFYRHVVKVFQEMEDATRELRDITQHASKHISIITNVSLYLPGLLKEMRQLDPDITIRQRSARKRRIIQALQEGQVDYAICCPLLKEKGMETTVLMREEGVVIYPPGHWLEQHNTIHLSELLDEPLISVAPGYGTRDAVEEYCEEQGVFPNFVVETTDTATIFQYVKSGIGISFAPLSLTLRDPFFSKHHAQIVAPPLYAEVGLTRLSDRYLTRSCQLFANVTKEYFRQLQQSR